MIKGLAKRFNVTSYPVIKIFGEDKYKPADYPQERNLNSIISYIIAVIRDQSRSRLYNKEKIFGSKKEKKEKVEEEPIEIVSDEDVVKLDDSNYEELVIASKYLWFVDAYAPWCDHCKELEPSWNLAAKELKGRVKLAKYDAAANTKLNSKWPIDIYPTIFVFLPKGLSSEPEKMKIYENHSATKIVAEANKYIEKYKIGIEIEQLVSEEMFSENCKISNHLCFILFVPHISNSSQEERNSYIDLFSENVNSILTKKIKGFWAQGSDHYKFEEKVNMGFNYPILSALSISKGKYTFLRRSYTHDNIKDFINSTIFIKKF